MKFSEIIKINNNLRTLKTNKKEFSYSLSIKLNYILNITDEIINKENIKLNKFVKKNGSFDGYEYSIKDQKIIDKFNKKQKRNLNKNIILDIYIGNELLVNDKFDLETIELLSPLIKN